MNEQELNDYIDNAPDPADSIDGDVKESDGEQDNELDNKKEQIPDSSGNIEEDGADVVKRIKGEVLGETPEEKDEEGEDIPDAFTEACLKQGWTEEEIVDFASGLDDAALLQLIPELFDIDDDEEQDDSESHKDETKQKVKPKPPKSTADSKSDADLAELKKEVAALKEELSKSTKEQTAREESAMVNAINQAFDEANENFEIFGKTEELLKYPAGPKKGQFVPTSPAMVARSEVWDKAYPFVKSGMPVKDAMEIALTWYKGKNLEKNVQRNVIKDLKKHEKKLSAKRSGKETVKVYENEEERKADVVREAARKAGVKNYGE